MVIDAFKNYAEWWERMTDYKLPGHPGLLPGDASYTLKKGNVSLGILGLNSAYLHLSDDVTEERGTLDVNLAQFNRACDGNGPAWVEKHDICLVLTHHPPSWLIDRGQSFVEDVCNGPERFQLHLFRPHAHRFV